MFARGHTPNMCDEEASKSRMRCSIYIAYMQLRQ